MTGGDVVSQVGVGSGTNLGTLGKGDAILVVASDLEEEAPIWWLRVKQAADRGAKVVVANPRPTKLNRAAAYSLDYGYGDAVGAINNMVAKVISGKLTDKDTLVRADGLKDLQASVKGERTRSGYTEATETLASANNLVILCGGEGLNLEQHGELMQACANLLILTGHVGRANNGLIPVWGGANVQGAVDLGYSPEATVSMFSEPPELLIVAGCDPVGEIDVAVTLQKADFIVVTSLFETATTDLADVVLPRQSFAERDGTFTSGERRVQRFYTAQGAIGQSLPDWKIFAQLRSLSYKSTPKLSAGAVMAEITKNVDRYAEMSYKNLAKVDRQFPDVGGDDLYYGGTAYQNTGGVGVQWAVDAEDEKAKLTLAAVKTDTAKVDGLQVIPTTVL
jgi:NADH-quinone oxidoreductase subunit G